MQVKLLRVSLIAVLSLVGLAIPIEVQSQSRSRTPRGYPTNRPPRPPEPAPNPSPTPPDATEASPDEVLKIDTDLVTVPVIATNRDGIYVGDLRQDEFSISEDGAKQEIAFFATINAPFHVVLMLDTSASAEDMLSQIRRAASAFIDQLQGADKVKVISFADTVKELSDFTNDRVALKKAIDKTTAGANTKLYDAFELAIVSLRPIRGRKAIVLFTDGMDWHSDTATFNGNMKWLDEEGVIVYPIRYDTRAYTERIAREQMNQQYPQLPSVGGTTVEPGGTTPTTFPSEEPNPVPTGNRRRTGPLGLPTATEILTGRRDRERDRDRRYPPNERLPRGEDPLPRPGDPLPGPGSDRTRRREEEDAIDSILDQAYFTADSYLLSLAEKSGGRLLRADKLDSLPDAFAKIAAELRSQYAIGYYPVNRSRDGRYRKIKVSTTRKNVVIRARPGYQVGG